MSGEAFKHSLASEPLQGRAVHGCPIGQVAFIGAGPGAADLITLRGARLLAQARVVLFDALTDPGLRAYAPQARWLDVGKRGFCNSTGQAVINALLVRQAQRGGLVVRLKGGDPSVFGRLEEELQALAQAGIASQVVPGITAALAAAADTQRPLTRRGRGRSVALTTAVSRQAQQGAQAQAGHLLAQSAGRPDTEVFYMAGRQLPALARQLLAAGWPANTAVCVVSRAGCEDSLASQHALQDLASASLLHASRPTVVTVGVGALALAGPTCSGTTAFGASHPALKSKALPTLAAPNTHAATAAVSP